MNLEDKFKKHIEKLQNNHFTVAIPKLIHDLAKIAEEDLQDENENLKGTIIANVKQIEELLEDFELQQKAINTLNDNGLKLMEENKQLKCTIAGLEKLLSNAVDETIIATGKVLPSAYGMLIGDKTMQEVSNKIAMYWNKNIEIAIKEATSQK